MHLEKLIGRLLAGDRMALSRAITLAESTLAKDREATLKILNAANAEITKRKTLRVAITGPPGAGKSSFIERLGSHLLAHGSRLAVLAIDPSSARTGGSILADKTRMPSLSNHPSVYIRPSPNRGTLGGIAQSTFESITLCEAAGYDLTLVETVGVGQSEFVAQDVCDMFIVLLPPGGGDELQGIKKGIIEAADLIVITKCDGDLESAARRSYAQSLAALHFARPIRKSWTPGVLAASALEDKNVDAVCAQIIAFRDALTASGELSALRRDQAVRQFWTLLAHQISSRLATIGGDLQALLAHQQNLIQNNGAFPSTATKSILDALFRPHVR